jgi:hypothetical protein
MCWYKIACKGDFGLWTSDLICQAPLKGRLLILHTHGLCCSRSVKTADTTSTLTRTFSRRYTYNLLPMKSFAVLLIAGSALAVAVSHRQCLGLDPPIPIHHRQHRGLVFASSITELGPSYDTWHRNMAEIASRILPVDNGYTDEGQPFEFVTALPVGSRPHKSYEIGNIDMGIDGSRDRWLAHLRASKVMVRPISDFH